MTFALREPGAQQSDIPQDAAEASEPFRGVTDGELVARIQELADSCDEHASGRYTTIRRHWRLYNERYDFSKKADWQSKISIPLTWRVVEGLVGLYTQGLLPNERWFRVTDRAAHNQARELSVEAVQQESLDASGFYELHRLALMSGFIAGVCPVKLGMDSTGAIPRPVLQLWDPLDMKMDWSGRNRFIILESELEPYMLEEWAELGMYDEARVREAIESPPSADILRTSNRWDRTIPTMHVQEFWGDLIKSDGRMWMRNCHCVIINKSVVLRRPIENPWIHGTPPLIIGMPLRVPFRVWPMGPIEHMSGMARMVTELANAVMDASLFAALQAYQYDLRRTRPADMRRGIYPGKMFPVTDLQAGPGIERFEAGAVPADVMGVLGWLDNETQRATGVTEHTTGVEQPGGRRKTAREVTSYLGQALGMMRTQAHDWERTFLEPLLSMMLSAVAQVSAMNRRMFFSPGLIEAMGRHWAVMLASAPAEIRRETLTRGIQFKARGISSSVEMNEDLQRLLAMAEAAAKAPELWGRINKRALLEKMLSFHRLSAEELLIPEEQFQQQQQRQAQMMAQAAGAGANAGGRRPGQLVRRRTQQMPGEPRRLKALTA